MRDVGTRLKHYARLEDRQRKASALCRAALMEPFDVTIHNNEEPDFNRSAHCSNSAHHRICNPSPVVGAKHIPVLPSFDRVDAQNGLSLSHRNEFGARRNEASFSNSRTENCGTFREASRSVEDTRIAMFGLGERLGKGSEREDRWL